MSQKDPKKGSRDISELKARLGLKKGPGAQPAGGKPNGAGVVPPPGLNLPPPPGARPPGHVIPNASDDPFGAMNAMAHIGAQQRAPEIVIINDGKPVESVSTGERAATIGKYAAIAIVPLILGLIVGQISKEAKVYNSGLSAVKKIQPDVDRVRKALGEMKQDFETAGILKDPEVSRPLSKRLDESTDKLTANKLAVFGIKQNQLSAELSQQVLVFYSLVQEIQDLIIDHNATASMEEAAIKVSEKQLARYGTKDSEVLKQVGIPYKIGLILTAGDPVKEEVQTARVVEIGAILCGQTVDSAKIVESGKCGEDDGVAGYLYRFDPTSIQWNKGKLHRPSGDADAKWPTGDLIVMSGSGALDALIKTTGATTAEAAYFKRLKKIYDKVVDAYTKGEDLIDELNKRSRAKERFTFFM